ncbi:MAG: GNAT family N-acetyltransferase [Treponema sp.]|jgi:Flp pilus assembly protein TadD/Leu/Phe-tRNA-protein transferase|nr:GNAT family N-acetyltransferase [Treponema sp.]
MKPLSAEIWYIKGLRLQQEGLLRPAVEAFTNALRLNPEHGGAYSGRGCAYYDLGLFDAAARDFTALIRIEPENAGAFYNRGMAYDRNRRYDEAVQDYSQAIRLEPGNAGAFHNRGNVYFRQNRPGLAGQDYSQTIRLEPDNANALHNRGMLYCQQGAYAQAMSDLLTMLRLRYPGEDAASLAALIPPNRLPEGEGLIQRLLRRGFYIDIKGNPQEAVIITPHFRPGRSVLFFHNLHIGKTIGRHLKKNGRRYTLRYGADFDAVMKRCVAVHGDMGLTAAFQYYFSILRGAGGPARPVSFALYQDGALAAGEIGAAVGRIYTSYTGYHDVSSAGTAQIILTARYLEKQGYAFWDFGPGGYPYKISLGAREMPWEHFKPLFRSCQARPGKQRR